MNRQRKAETSVMNRLGMTVAGLLAVHVAYGADYRGRTVSREGHLVIHSGSYLRAKDWAEAPNEKPAANGRGYFDYSVARHEVQTLLDTSGCSSPAGKAKVSVAFMNTMHRDGMGRNVVVFGVLDPDRFDRTGEFFKFTESSQARHRDAERRIREKAKITNPACVVGKTFFAQSAWVEVPCDGKEHRGRIWVTGDPSQRPGKDLAGGMNQYEVLWTARAAPGTPGEVGYELHVHPSLVQQKKYIVPEVGEFLGIPFDHRVAMGSAREQTCAENIVQVPEFSTLAPFGITAAEFPAPGTLATEVDAVQNAAALTGRIGETLKPSGAENCSTAKP